MTLSLTALGTVSGTAVLDRGSLKPGDELYVTGTIGEAHLGLLVLRGELGGLPEETLQALIARYRLPEPRLAAGQALLADDLARSALDVSDGLAADLGHLLVASGVGGRSEERVEGKSVSVRVDLGGSRILKKKTKVGRKRRI